jgi:hypothetical protein
MAVDGDLSEGLAVNLRVPDIREIVELLSIIQKYKRNDGKRRDKKHEDALVFSKDVDHNK